MTKATLEVVEGRLYQGGGDRAAGGMADHDGVLDAEPVRGHADPAFLVRGLVAAAGPGW